jgi:hypothetical protein
VARGSATPARQLSDGVVDTRFRASDDHRAPAVIDDIDRDLPTHTGTAADNNDLLGLKCIFVPLAPAMFWLDAHILRASPSTVWAYMSKQPAIARISCGAVIKRATGFECLLTFY